MRALPASLLTLLVACSSESPEATDTVTPLEETEVAVEVPEVAPEATETAAVEAVEEAQEEAIEEATTEVDGEVSNLECVVDGDCDGPFVHCKVRVCEDNRCVVENAPNGSGCNIEACLFGEACMNGVCTGGEPTQPCGDRQCGSDSCNRSCGTCAESETCVDDLCLETSCPDGVKRVFVTSQSFNGDLAVAGGTGDDGLAGGDALCTLVAEAAGIGGTWRAWLSADGVDAIDRIADVAPWHTTGPGCAQVFPSRAAITVYGPEVAIEHDERGRPVNDSTWTGTDENGRSDTLDCEGWTMSVAWIGNFRMEEGLIGVPGATVGSSQWTSSVSHPCDFENALYCFEQ